MAQQLVLPQDEREQKASAVKAISLGLVAAALAGEIVVIIIWLMTDRSFPIITATMLDVGVTLIGLLSYWLARARWVRFAGYFLVITFSLETAVITLLFGGATGPLAVIYIFPILVSGMVLGISYSFLAATLVTALYLAMIPVWQSAIITPVLVPAEEGSIIPLFIGVWVIFFYLVAFLSWFAASRLNQALQGTRRYAAELQAANEKLRASEEELRASNEELRATEEELRTSNEELETANEELREAQEQLIRSERLAAIGQLAGGVGHELRNPLGAIKNAVYYIKGKVTKSELADKEPRVMQFLDIVDDEINASNKIINDLLSFSRVGKPAVSPIRVEKIIEGALSRMTIPENIKVAKRLKTELNEIEVDSDQIQQVLINVITNAVQAMPGGGKLTISAEEKNGFLEMGIADTGSGIPPEIKDKIFEPLFTTKAKGIGLGLAVSKSIIDRHRGHIEVESKVGMGTTFNIKLPAKAA